MGNLLKMKSFVVSLLIAAVLVNSESMAARITQHNSQRGIFSKLIAEQEEEHSFEKEITDAKERKRIQLAEAEKEHDAAVEQEEKEEAENREKTEAARAEKEEEDKKDLARKK